MARNDSSHVARALQPDLHDPEFIGKGHPGQKPPEPCRSAAAPQTRRPQGAEDRTPCCVLGDLRKIPQCVQHLGPLGHSGTVLVDVRRRRCQVGVSESGLGDHVRPFSDAGLPPDRSNRASARQRHVDQKLRQTAVLTLEHHLPAFRPRGA